MKLKIKLFHGSYYITFIFGSLSNILAVLCVLFLTNTHEICHIAISDDVFSLFLELLAGISLGGSVFIKHCTPTFLVFTGQEVQHVQKVVIV